MLSGEVSFGSACACRPVAIELGLVEQSLPHIEQGGIGAASGQRRVEAAMGVHPRRIDAVACEWCSDAEYMVGGNKVRFPISVAVGDRLADGETLDVAACPGEISEVVGRQGGHSET